MAPSGSRPHLRVVGASRSDRNGIARRAIEPLLELAGVMEVLAELAGVMQMRARGVERARIRKKRDLLKTAAVEIRSTAERIKAAAAELYRDEVV